MIRELGRVRQFGNTRASSTPMEIRLSLFHSTSGTSRVEPGDRSNLRKGVNL